jgi:anaerobic dimethyl sulfoxide reductase subunit A
MQDSWKLSRRSLLKWTGAMAGIAAAGGLSSGTLLKPTAAEAGTAATMLQTSCNTNCGGRCVINAHVKDGVIVRLETDPDPDAPDQYGLRACLRGRSARQIIYHPDRLKYPMKRVGKRGEGKFERISWDEATTIIARETKRLLDKHGPLSVYSQYASGIQGLNRGDLWAQRLVGEYAGDFLNRYGTYSSGQTNYATPFTYGTGTTGNMRWEWAKSKLIILMGFNPAENVFGTNTMYYLRKAKEAGAKILVIDPRYTDTAITLADEWIPIRPSTDGALLDAMAYVMISENLQDQTFLDKYCLGFDEEHMPKDVPAGNAYKTYVMGQADGQARTPEWAEKITGIPAARIRQLAREYATVKPGALIQGYGPQRHANGEQTVRSATLLASMTGNVGISGGWASGVGSQPWGVKTGAIPKKGGKVSISCFLWTDAIVRGKEMTAKDDLIQGADTLPSNIKMIFNLAGNTLINQHSDINKTKQILADESLCEFIVTSDLFMTPSAQWSDLVLPGASHFERENIVGTWGFGEYLMYSKPIVKPLYESRAEYDWLSEVAEKMGIGQQFTQGRTAVDWLRSFCETTAKSHPDFPGFDEFRQKGIFKAKFSGPAVAFAAQIADPEKNKFPTPSGKIELFSQRLFDRQRPKEVPAVPKYVPAFEGPDDPLRAKYPLQMTGWHIKKRVHSSLDNNPWMVEAARQEVWMNPADAEPRSIRDNDSVKLFNDRGAIVLLVKVTPRVMPGVVAVPQGAWHKPGADGVDTAGSINVLTTQRGSYMSNSNPQHTNLVEVVRA